MSAFTSEPQGNARAAIAHKYCRTIAVIDDEVFEKPNPRTLTESYNTLRIQCEKQSILCHLHHFDDLPSEPDDDLVDQQVNRAVNAAKAADVVILDWHLGRADSPMYALRVLDNILKEQRVHFVLIYTQETNLNDVKRDLKDHISALVPLDRSESQPKDLTDEEPDEIDEAPSSSIPVAQAPDAHDFHLDNRLFIFIRGKAALDANNLVSEVHRALIESFPDYLHWAALEMAYRVRELLPKVVAALPSGTDTALQFQLFHQRAEEVAEQVAEVVLDEIRFSLQQDPLKAVRDAEIFDHIKERMLGIAGNRQDLFRIVKPINADLINKYEAAARKTQKEQSPSQEEQSAFDTLEDFHSLWAAADLNELHSLLDTEDEAVYSYFLLSKNKSKKLHEAIHAFLDGDLEKHIHWATIRESVLLISPHQPLQTGYVLRLTEDVRNQQEDERQKRLKENPTSPTPRFGKERPEWLLCITPGCDCYRPTGNGFVFVAGKSKQGAEKSNARLTQSCVKSHEVIWDASYLVVEEALQWPLTLADLLQTYEIQGAPYEFYGALRDRFTARIIQRVWSYQSRVAVDTSEYLRKARDE